MSAVDIKKIAQLANMDLDASLQKRLEAKFETVKQYFDALVLVDTSTLPTPKNQEHLVPFREDEAQKSNLGISFSPYVEGGYFRVPKVLE